MEKIKANLTEYRDHWLSYGGFLLTIVLIDQVIVGPLFKLIMTSLSQQGQVPVVITEGKPSFPFPLLAPGAQQDMIGEALLPLPIAPGKLQRRSGGVQAPGSLPHLLQQEEAGSLRAFRILFMAQ